MKTKQMNLCHYLLGLTSLTLDQLDELCDDPNRDSPKGTEVQAVLTYDSRNGFFLSAQDGKNAYSITENDGQPVKFRTIEQAIEVLRDMQVSTDVRLDISGSTIRR